MSINLGKNSGNTGEDNIIGKFKAARKDLTTEDLNDLIKFTKGKSWHGKAPVFIKLLFSGKGFITKENAQKILDDHENNIKNGVIKTTNYVNKKIKDQSHSSDLNKEHNFTNINFQKKDPYDYLIYQDLNLIKKNMQNTAEKIHWPGLTKINEPFDPSKVKFQESQKIIQQAQVQTQKTSSLTEEEIVKEKWNQLEKDTQAQLENPKAKYYNLVTNPFYYLKNKIEVTGRFSNISCTRHTAVYVENKVSIPGSTQTKMQREYIHANHVRNENSSIDCVVSQAPRPDDYPNVWKAIFFDRDVIVDLSGNDDRLNGVTEYAPLNFEPVSLNNPDGSPQKHGDITVTLQKTQEDLLPISPEERKNLIANRQDLPKITIYTYELKDNEGKTKIVQRLHFPSWADHKTISNDQLDKLVGMFDGLFKDKNIFMHCRAGVGRSGVLTAAMFLKEMVAKGTVTKENYRDKISEMLLEMRIQRGLNNSNGRFVQTEDQLALLHSYTAYLLDNPK